MEEEKRIKELLNEPLNKLGYDLYEVKFKPTSKEGPKLEVVIDRVTPISLDDIVSVSEAISAILDENDPIERAYTLDVSSLGAEKPIRLEALEDYRGRYVHLHLSHPYEGANDLEGELSSVSEQEISLIIKVKSHTKTIAISRGSVDRARLAIKF